MMEVAIARSYPDPYFGISAGANPSTIFLLLSLMPEFLMAALILSLDSATALSASPTT